MASSQHVVYAWIAAALLSTSAFAAPAANPSPERARDWHWVASWGSAQQVPEPHNELPADQWRDASLRQIVHMSLGGSRLRVRLSNVFGTAPLLVSGASVAKAVALGQAGIEPGSSRTLTFGGRSAVTIPAGAEYYSDVVTLEHAAGSNLAVSMYFKDAPARQTSHPGSRTTSFVAKGNQLAETAWPEASKVVHWYQLTDIEVQAPRSVGAVVAIGDSITDGRGAGDDTNQRWPDFLSKRLRKGSAGTMGVVNAGIGGGRMLHDGLGPNLAARFERDVLARSGVTHAIVLIGVNDLGGMHRSGNETPEVRKAMLEALQAAHTQLIERAHARGVCVIGATLTPYSGGDYYKPEPHNEADRQLLNAWIRSPGVFDGVADFDAAVRQAAQPQLIQPEFDSGDRLHLSPAGYRALADSVPLAALKRCGHKK